MRCPTYVLLLLQGLLHNCCCRIVVNGRLSMPIARKRGLLQGSVLSPWLFNIFIDDLARTIEQECCYGNAPAGLFFADDIQLQGEANTFQYCPACPRHHPRIWVSANEMAVNISSERGHFSHGQRQPQSRFGRTPCGIPVQIPGLPLTPSPEWTGPVTCGTISGRQKHAHRLEKEIPFQPISGGCEAAALQGLLAIHARLRRRNGLPVSRRRERPLQ